jgi:hypothetical protein
MSAGLPEEESYSHHRGIAWFIRFALLNSPDVCKVPCSGDLKELLIQPQQFASQWVS